MVMPERGRLRFNYPRNGASIGYLFRSKFVQGIVQGDAGSAQPPLGLLQNYVAGQHWHKLIISFAEERVYYYEPFGSRLRARGL